MYDVLCILYIHIYIYICIDIVCRLSAESSSKHDLLEIVLSQGDRPAVPRQHTQSEPSSLGLGRWRQDLTSFLTGLSDEKLKSSALCLFPISIYFWVSV